MSDMPDILGDLVQQYPAWEHELSRLQSTIIWRVAPYNLASVRQLLLRSFGTTQDLWRFCRDRCSLRFLCDYFNHNWAQVEAVDAVITQCITRDILDELLGEIESENPRQYARFRLRLQEPEFVTLFRELEPTLPNNLKFEIQNALRSAGMNAYFDADWPVAYVLLTLVWHLNPYDAVVFKKMGESKVLMGGNV